MDTPTGTGAWPASPFSQGSPESDWAERSWPGFLCPGPLLPVPGHRCIDDARVEFPHRRRTRPHPFHHPGPEVLDQHVGPRDEGLTRDEVFRILEVGREARLFRLMEWKRVLSPSSARFEM